MFKYFLIYKTKNLLQQKKNSKNLKNPKISKKLFRWFKIRTLYLGVNNPSQQLLLSQLEICELVNVNQVKGVHIWTTEFPLK